MRVLAVLLAVMAPVPALALSCLAPDVARSYGIFAAEPEPYVVVHGRLTLDARLLPKAKASNRKPPRGTEIPGKLQGTSLSKEGFKLPFEQDVTLRVRCLGSWCGTAQNGADVLAFVRKDADGYVINIGPCGGSVFTAPKPAMLKRVQRCMAKDACGLE